MAVFHKDRFVHRVHNMIAARLPGLPVLMDAEEFKGYCEECFQDAPLHSAAFKMEVLTNTTVNKKRIPPLEKEFVHFIEKTVVGERGDLFDDKVVFGDLAVAHILDYFELSRWFYKRFTYETGKVEGKKGSLLSISTYKKRIVPLPMKMRQRLDIWRFQLDDIQVLYGGWWDFRFSINDVDWYRVRKGEISKDRDFEFLPEQL